MIFYKQALNMAVEISRSCAAVGAGGTLLYSAAPDAGLANVHLLCDSGCLSEEWQPKVGQHGDLPIILTSRSGTSIALSAAHEKNRRVPAEAVEHFLAAAR